jgi:hypothetical protein
MAVLPYPDRAFDRSWAPELGAVAWAGYAGDQLHAYARAANDFRGLSLCGRVWQNCPPSSQGARCPECVALTGGDQTARIERATALRTAARSKRSRHTARQEDRWQPEPR